MKLGLCGPSCSRRTWFSEAVQVLWTLIVMIVYFHEAVSREPGSGLPTIPPELLTVMGISGAVYLTSKQMDRKKGAGG